MAPETENKQDTYNNCFISRFPGSLRDWYAGQALSGWLSSYTSFCEAGPEQRKDIAELCFELADAMIAEGNRKEEPNDD